MGNLENQNRILFIHQKPTLYHQDHPQRHFYWASSLKSEKKFQAIVEAVQVGIWVIFVKSSLFANTIFEFFLRIKKQTSKQTMRNNLWQMVISALGEFCHYTLGRRNYCFGYSSVILVNCQLGTVLAMMVQVGDFFFFFPRDQHITVSI